MRKTLSAYGWIVILTIILSILVAAATPAGHFIMNKMFEFTDTLTIKGVQNGLVDSSKTHSIQIKSNPNNVLKVNKTTALPGETIMVQCLDNDFYYCDSLSLEYGGKKEEVQGMAFTMPNTDVIIDPVWKDFPFSKIYFEEDITSAQRAANIVHDTDFQSRAPININGKNCYVVHDYSEVLGYNDNLKIDLYQNSNSIIRVIVGSTCKNISLSAFYNDTNLRDVVISNSTETIEKAAFYNCGKMNTLILGNELTEVQEYAFYNCASLGIGEVLSLPDTLTTVGGSSFAYTGYNDLSFSPNLTTVGNFAFYGTNIPSNFNFPQHIRNTKDFSFILRESDFTK